MHERNGDFLTPREPNARSPVSRTPSPPPPVKDVVKSPVVSQSIVDNDAPETHVSGLMTRRFNVAEKIRIIEKYKETEN